MTRPGRRVFYFHLNPSTCFAETGYAIILLNRLGSLPNGRALPACPADLFNAGMPLGRWQVPNDAEKGLDAFLAALPAYQRKQFEPGISSFTQEEMNQWAAWMATTPEQFDGLLQEYLRLLQRVPARLREYLKRQKREYGPFSSALNLPKIPAGAPRKDALANEAAQLKKAGLSYTQIAIRLNVMRDGKPNGELIRGLLKSRKLKARKAAPPPDKT